MSAGVVQFDFVANTANYTTGMDAVVVKNKTVTESFSHIGGMMGEEGDLTHGLRRSTRELSHLGAAFGVAGGEGTRFALALTQVLAEGLNSVALVVVAAGVGIGKLIEAHKEAEEAAKKHKEEIAKLVEELEAMKAATHDLLTGDKSAQLFPFEAALKKAREIESEIFEHGRERMTAEEWAEAWKGAIEKTEIAQAKLEEKQKQIDVEEKKRAQEKVVATAKAVSGFEREAYYKTLLADATTEEGKRILQARIAYEKFIDATKGLTDAQRAELSKAQDIVEATIRQEEAAKRAAKAKAEAEAAAKKAAGIEAEAADYVADHTLDGIERMIEGLGKLAAAKKAQSIKERDAADQDAADAKEVSDAHIENALALNRALAHLDASGNTERVEAIKDGAREENAALDAKYHELLVNMRKYGEDTKTLEQAIADAHVRIAKKELEDVTILGDDFAKGFEAQLQRMQRDQQSMGQLGAQISQQLVSSTSSGLANALIEIETHSKSAKDAFKDFAVGVLVDLQRIILEAYIARIALAALGLASGGGDPGTGTSTTAGNPSSGGADFPSGGASYAKSMRVGGSTRVEVHNHGTPQKVDSAEESIDADGVKRLKLMMSDALADDVARGGSASRSMEAAYGLSRATRRR